MNVQGGINSSAGKIIIAGGSGLIGSQLRALLEEQGRDVTILTRGEAGDGHVKWDGAAPGEWTGCLEGAAAVVNLCGKSINCRLTPKNRKELLESRTRPTLALLDAARNCKAPPKVFIQASAVGFYGDCVSVCTEKTPRGRGSLADICVEWEAAFNSIDLPDTRKITARFGVVLSVYGGAFPVLHNLATMFLGGQAGDGAQYLSWVHEEDAAAVLARMIDDPSMRGVYNIAAPRAVTNAEFMKKLRKKLRRPWSPPVPEICIRLSSLFMNTNPELVLTGQNAVPRGLLDAGFEFRYGKIEDALDSLCVD